MQCRILSCIVQMTLLYHYRHYHHRYPNIKHYGAKEEASSDTRRVNVNWKTISDYVCVSYEHDFLLKWIVKKSMIFLHWFQENLFSRSISLANTQVENNSTLYIVFIFVKWQTYIWIHAKFTQHLDEYLSIQKRK